MPLSTFGRQTAYASATKEIWFYLVTIEHPDLPATLRFVARRKDEDVVSNGETYKAFPFEIAFPDSQPDQPPKSRVRIDAIGNPDDPDNDVISIVRGIKRGKPVISLQTVLQSNPDVVEASAPGMLLASVDFDRLTIEGDLTYEDTLNEPYPGNSYNAVEWPGVRGVA
jgi:hypothetical protein